MSLWRMQSGSLDCAAQVALYDLSGWAPLPTAFHAFEVSNVLLAGFAKRCNVVLVEDNLARLALRALRDALIDHVRPPLLTGWRWPPSYT
jgi:hypothetical protein